jgi:hypothetical protein
MDLLLTQCRKQRDEWLRMVRLHLGTLRAMAGAWEALRPFLADAEQIETLERLHEDLNPQLRLPVPRTESPRKLRAALGELVDSIKAFNRRWQAFLEQVDLRPVNEQRVNYNRYYLLEKECLVRSVRVARQGFQRMEPLTNDELSRIMPTLPMPRAIAS